MLRFKGVDPAYPCSEKHGKPVGIHLSGNAALIDGLLGGSHRKLSVAVCAEHIIDFQVLTRVKSSDFGGLFGFEFFRIE